MNTFSGMKEVHDPERVNEANDVCVYSVRMAVKAYVASGMRFSSNDPKHAQKQARIVIRASF